MATNPHRIVTLTVSLKDGSPWLLRMAVLVNPPRIPMCIKGPDIFGVHQVVFRPVDAEVRPDLVY